MGNWYFVFLGCLVLVLIGLIVYARVMSGGFKKKDKQSDASDGNIEAAPALSSNKSNGRKNGHRKNGKKRPLFGIKGSGGNNSGEVETILPSEDVVDIVDIIDDYYLTPRGDLVAILYIQPVLSTTTSSPDGLIGGFIKSIHNMQSTSSIQFVQLPMPSPVEGLTDRYAMHAHSWKKEHEKAVGSLDEDASQVAKTRYFAAHQIGAHILTVGGSAPRRESFAVLTQKAGVIGSPSDEAIAKAVRELKVAVQRVVTLFKENGITMIPLHPSQSLEVLWHAYNPDSGSSVIVDQASERYLEMAQTGNTTSPMSTVLSREQIQKALDDPKNEIRKLLAPPVVEELPSAVQFNRKTMAIYYFTDYKQSIPTIRKLLGAHHKFAHRLYLSYYISTPNISEIALATRRASTAKQAVDAVAARLGSLPSYRQREEIESIEDARWGAETEKDVPKMLTCYVGLVGNNETIHQDAIDLESIFQSAGVDFVPAKFVPLKVWRTMIPLGQRTHRSNSADRNVFADNLGPLNPVTSLAVFNPDGEFCGYTPAGGDALMPVAIVRKRGTEFIPSDAIIGTQGSGKSFTIKYWITDWISRGHKVFVVDPKMEFGPTTAALGGTAVSILGSTGFNLIQFENIPVDHDTELGVALAKMTFDDNLAAIEALYSMSKGDKANVTGVERNFLINAFRRAMETKGMDPKDPRTWKANEVFLNDVYETLTREMMHEDTQTVKMMGQLLEQYADKNGQYYEQYNTPNTFSLDSDLITATFGLAQLGADVMTKSLASHFAMRIAIQHAVRSFLLEDVPPPYHIVIDEASQLLTTSAVVSNVISMLSLLSAYDISVHLAFQDIKALTRADSLGAMDGAASMNTLMGVIPAYWIFHQEPSSAQYIVETFNLPQEEQKIIVQNRVGQCILMFPKVGLRIPIVVQVPEQFTDMYRTDPEFTKRMIENALRRKVEPAATAA